MLKFLHEARISNFRIVLANLSPDFKHAILFHLDELLGLRYMIGKLELSSSHPNFNRNKIPLVTLDMSQTLHWGLVWHIWQDSSTNSEPMKYYVSELYLTWKFTIIYFHVFNIS
jgi:hypothetical protein